MQPPPPNIDFDQPPVEYPSCTDIDEMLILNRQGIFDKEVLFKKLLRTKAEINLERFITADPLMLELKSRVESIIRMPYNRFAPVLITGPSGTGKEIIARAFTVISQPFVAQNCAGFPKDLIQSLLFGHRKGTFTGATEDRDGIFIQAGEGVVFLDEIGELPLEAQAILLRVLQERTVARLGSIDEQPVRCRIVTATKRNLQEMVRLGTFREDLFARLMTFELHITGLLDRPGDIPLIAQQGFDQFNQPLVYSAPIPDALMPDIELYNVRAIQCFVARMRTYGNY